MRIPIDLGPLEIADLLEARADDDELAAEAYEVFGRAVFPFEGVFIEADVSARGSLAELLRAAPLDLPRLRRWVPALCCAVRDLGSPLGDAVADALVRLLSGPADDGEPFELQLAPPDLFAATTDLRELARWLCTPAQSGLFLSTPVLERIGRDVGVPRGFGSRPRLLTNLLRSGARFGQAASVVGALQEIVERHRSRLAEPPLRIGALRAATEPWAARLGETSLLLAEMGDRLAALPGGRASA